MADLGQISLGIWLDAFCYVPPFLPLSEEKKKDLVHAFLLRSHAADRDGQIPQGIGGSGCSSLGLMDRGELGIHQMHHPVHLALGSAFEVGNLL